MQSRAHLQLNTSTWASRTHELEQSCKSDGNQWKINNLDKNQEHKSGRKRERPGEPKTPKPYKPLRKNNMLAECESGGKRERPGEKQTSEAQKKQRPDVFLSATPSHLNSNPKLLRGFRAIQSSTISSSSSAMRSGLGLNSL